MGSVPVWVLIVNTIITALATGGIAALSLFVVPKKEQAARTEEERRANAVIMRDKAEQIFTAISELEDAAQKQLIAAMQARITGQSVEAPLVRNDSIRALAAVYYPGLLPILSRFEAPAEERRERVADVLTAAQGADPQKLKAAGDALVAQRVKYMDIQFRNAGLLAQLLRDQLTDDVRPYLPA